MSREDQPKQTLRTRLRHPVVRYAFGVATVVMAFALQRLLEPITGTGAPFVVFFGSVLLTSLYAGIGPGLTATISSVPLGSRDRRGSRRADLGGEHRRRGTTFFFAIPQAPPTQSKAAGSGARPA